VLGIQIDFPAVDAGFFKFGFDAEENGRPAPSNWRDWLITLFPKTFTGPFADRHIQAWEWVEKIRAGEKLHPSAYVDIAARGGGKTTTVETAVVRLGAEKRRQFALYVRGKQEKANESIGSIAEKIESDEIAASYPAFSKRSVTKYGHSKGWTMKLLRCGNGFNVIGVGLDALNRGVKLGDMRPDLIIFDDVDADGDSIEIVEKKIGLITKSIIPTGAPHCVYWFAQNLIHPNSIAARLVSGEADFLQDRVVSGPHPAVIDLKTENRNGVDYVLSGTPTWGGQDLDICQSQIWDWGLTAFKEEAQHEVFNRSGQIFLPEWFSIPNGRNRFSVNDHRLFNTCIGRFQFWDTALKDKRKNDPSMCITVDLTPNYTLLLRDVWTDRIESAYLPEVIHEQASKWRYDGKLQEIVIEDKGSGTTSIQTIRKNANEWLVDMIREFTPFGSKDYRAKTASMWMPRNCFALPYPDTGLVWYVDLLDDLKGQFFRFAGEGTVPHDEFIDCVSMCILYLEHYLSQGYYARLANQSVLEERPSSGLHTRVARALAEESYD